MNNVKPTELHIAEKVLLDAGDAIRERLKEHGHTERSFQMVADMWTSYTTHCYTIRGETKLYPHDVALMMDLVKTARSVYGFSVDNFTDKAGYASLAALLHPGIEKPKPSLMDILHRRKEPDTEKPQPANPDSYFDEMTKQHQRKEPE